MIEHHKYAMVLTDRFAWIYRMMQKDKLGQDMFLIGYVPLVHGNTLEISWTPDNC